MIQEIRVRHNKISIPTTNKTVEKVLVMTVVSNMLNYGYVLSKEAYEKLTFCENIELWWEDTEKILKKITGQDREIGKYVVYKNFPQEVLEKTEAEYWFNQILMYWGLPNEIFTQEEIERDPLFESVDLNVLDLADENTDENIYMSLLRKPNRWTGQQKSDFFYLFSDVYDINLDRFGFKENMVAFACENLSKVGCCSATDVLRIAAGLCGGDISLREKTKFKLNRKNRKDLLRLLDKCKNIEEDICRNKGLWKRLFRSLHPGDYPQFNNVIAVYNNLYNNNLPTTYNSIVEFHIKNKNSLVFSYLKSRPGDFVRRLFKCIKTFGEETVNEFVEVLPKLDTIQLAKIKGQLRTAPTRKFRCFPPKGNWSRLKIFDNKDNLNKDTCDKIIYEINKELKRRLPTVLLGKNTDWIKFQTNDNELSEYGRGTVFPLGDNINFIRSASYWETGHVHHNIWYDNGWNFFDNDWKPISTCCWNSNPSGSLQYAVFSGDPTNSKELKGRACQLIDIYIDRAISSGVRYGVWNILAYSNIKFSEAKDVRAMLQVGENPEKGKLFEPSRCKFSFKITGDSLTKYVAYVDFLERKIVYMDANLKGNVRSANNNGNILSETIPAYIEYMEALPTVKDVFECANKSKDGLPIYYTDRDIEIQEKGYSFLRENENNSFEQVDLINLIKE